MIVKKHCGPNYEIQLDVSTGLMYRGFSVAVFDTRNYNHLIVKQAFAPKRNRAQQMIALADAKRKFLSVKSLFESITA